MNWSNYINELVAAGIVENTFTGDGEYCFSEEYDESGPWEPEQLSDEIPSAIIQHAVMKSLLEKGWSFRHRVKFAENEWILFRPMRPSVVAIGSTAEGTGGRS